MTSLFTRVLLMQNVNTKSEKPILSGDQDGLHSGSQVPGGLLHDPLCGDQVNDDVGCLIEVLLGPIMVSQLLAL
jgi:hypothetical protein